jgi:pyruvate dehydrogenase E2 component (dihydrolipoamide acetyltransferase)
VSIEIIKLPDIGGASEVDVIEVNVAVGDIVDAEQTLIVLETDKASMEIPSPQAGKIVSVLVSEGDKINEGASIVELELDTSETIKDDQSESISEVVDAVHPTEEVQQELLAEVEPIADDTDKFLLSVTVPDIGGATDVDVIEVAVAVGYEVIEGDSLIVLETDKASMEIPAPSTGIVTELHIKEGDKVNEGDLFVVLQIKLPVEELQQTQVTVEPATSVDPQAAKVDAAKANIEIVASKTSSIVHAGPAVRKIAREFGVDLGKVQGSGPKGRIIKEDVQKYVKAALESPIAASASVGNAIPQVPEVDFAKFGPIREEPMSKIAKITALNMQRSWLNVPHVTQRDEVNISDLEDFRKSIKDEAAKDGVKVTPIAFIIKACAIALTHHPKFASSLSADGTSIIYKDYINIGMAVDTPAGLVVPVIKDANKKSIYQLSIDVVELATKAKERKLTPMDMQGGCFTISSLGNIGGTGFTPIVNAPEVAILGVSSVAIKPVWDGADFVPGKMLPLSLSYDHRVINGGDGGRFMAELNALLGDVRRLAL